MGNILGQIMDQEEMINMGVREFERLFCLFVSYWEKFYISRKIDTVQHKKLDCSMEKLKYEKYTRSSS